MIAIDGLKEAAKVLQEAGKLEQYKQILEAQEKLLEQQEKISTQTEEIRELKEQMKIKGSLEFENNVYWIKKGDKKDGPYCSCCEDKDNKLIRMHPCMNKAFSECPNCKTRVQIDPNYSFQTVIHHRNDPWMY